MHDPFEYPRYPRHHVWYFDQVVPVSTSIFSPIFDVDRGMGVTAATSAPAGPTAAGNPDHLMRTIPIGTRIQIHIAEISAVGAVNFRLFGAMSPAVNPLVQATLADIPTPSGSVLIIDSVSGFPYIQVALANLSAVNAATVAGAFRVYPS